MSNEHREALATIIYGVACRKGFIVCSGEVGMGKTTVLQAFLEQTSPEEVVAIYIFTPKITPTEITAYLCRELGIDEDVDGFFAIQQLQLRLLEFYQKGMTVALIVDEAQTLPIETLEHLRLLSNFETESEKLLQIILVGQPELDDILARRDMRQVNQRVTLRCRLKAFTEKESVSYIHHRLIQTGAARVGQVLDSRAVRAIARAGGGIPRRINILADNVLIGGYGAQQRPVGGRLAQEIINQYLELSGIERVPKSGFFERIGL